WQAAVRRSAFRFRCPCAAPPGAIIRHLHDQRVRKQGEHAMTPQESELVDELFNRLVQLETAQRDPEAERLIADGLRRAPHAVYALVQTVLLQDEALKRANARIEELQVQTSAAAEPEQGPASFLDSMREALGGRAPHGSVPSVRAAGANQSQGQQPQPGYPR